METLLKELGHAVAPYLAMLVLAVLAAAGVAWKNAMIYIAQKISDAAQDPTLTTGKMRMDWVVEQARLYLPTLLRMIITDAKVRENCQSIYNSMKGFAIAYFTGEPAPEYAEAEDENNE